MPSHRIPRRTFLKTAGAALLAAGPVAAAPANRPNVLFICVDDLRPQLNCYGKNFMQTPNLDRLAAEGTVFSNHFVQVPTCGASRCSLLTGQRPHAPGRLGNGAFTTLNRDEPTDPVTMPHLFQQNGYSTVSVGKVSHLPTGRRCPKPSGRFDKDGNMTYSGPGDDEHELPFGWDKAYGPTGEWGDPWSAFFAYAGGKTRSYTEEKSPAVEAADLPDTGYPDGLIAEAAIKELQTLKDDPFFLSVGFYKPHLPFTAPKKYWDLYNRDEIPLAEHKDPPANVDLPLSLHR
ncbi:MAG: sulfatase-like hydrolase/transferase, partial [bacterium]|nr:sulfatase-like hydrolase/transferase [bacterium]